MGSAVSSVTGLIGGTLGSVVSPITGAAGGAINSAIQPLIQGVLGALATTPVADQTQLENNINDSQQLASQYSQAVNATQGQANSALQNATQGINASQNAINNAQGYVQNANQVNQGYGSNVNNALGLVGQTAAGGGAAQQAAAAQLQQGTNTAIASQHALANSGNLSQMIGGQKTAMENAATLQQGNALNAAQLQAGMAGTAQGQYTGAAAQQASQAGVNAGLQQNQTEQQLANQVAQQNLYGTAQGAATNYAGASNAAQGNAISGQTAALNAQQDALMQTGANQALAIGGITQAVAGGAASKLGLTGVTSDKNLKKDIKSGDEDVSNFFRAIDAKKFNYKNPDNMNGKTPGEHLGVMAQDVEKTPYGKSLIMELPEGKGIDMASAVGALMAHASNTVKKLDLLETLLDKSSLKEKKLTRSNLENLLKKKEK